MTNDDTSQSPSGRIRRRLPVAFASALLAVLTTPLAVAADTDWVLTSPSDRMTTEIGSGLAGGDTSYDDVARSRPPIPCRECNDSQSLCGCDRQTALAGGLLENLSLFAGLEGSKQPQDFGVNANFGGRFHANLGIPLIESEGLGLQIGTSLNYTDNAVQVFERLNGYRDRFQNFTTVGLFRRANNGWTWAAGYDFLFQDYYDNFNLGQWRGDVSYRLDRCNELGTWFAIRGHSDDGFYDAIPLTLRPITQGSLYWRRNWENDIQTTLWAGIADGHGEVNLALGDLEPVNERFVFGADVFVPISPKLAIFGQANFITPADSGTVDSFFGL